MPFFHYVDQIVPIFDHLTTITLVKELFYCCKGKTVDINSKVHIFWEGHKILQNLHRRLDRYYIGQIYGGDFAKFYGLYMNFITYLTRLVNVVDERPLSLVHSIIATAHCTCTIPECSSSCYYYLTRVLYVGMNFILWSYIGLQKEFFSSADW